MFGSKKDENDKDQEEMEKEDVIVFPKSKAVLLKKLLSNISENASKINDILGTLISPEDEEKIKLSQLSDDSFSGGSDSESGPGRIIEGVFDGESMIGPDGRRYPVPANYASKSKLVEGDIMKLTITENGTFIYKQIGPMDGVRENGILEKSSDGNFYAVSNHNRWKVLTASVTFYKGEPGDEAIILIPKAGESKWAAIENIIKQG